MPKRDFLSGFELIVLLAFDSDHSASEWDLEEKGLVSSALGDSTPERGGRAKRYFHVTALGLRAVRSTRRALESLWHRLPQLEGV